MLFVALLFLALSAYVAIGNIVGTLRAWRNEKQGIPNRYSPVPMLSLGLATIAWVFGRSQLGPWPWLPALLDPGTWILFWTTARPLFRSRKP